MDFFFNIYMQLHWFVFAGPNNNWFFCRTKRFKILFEEEHDLRPVHLCLFVCISFQWDNMLVKKIVCFGQPLRMMLIRVIHIPIPSEKQLGNCVSINECVALFYNTNKNSRCAKITDNPLRWCFLFGSLKCLMVSLTFATVYAMRCSDILTNLQWGRRVCNFHVVFLHQKKIHTHYFNILQFPQFRFHN